MSVMETVSYRSPTRKLLPFFQRSRDKWKAKCLEAKRENKSLKYRLAQMKELRDRWKAKARDLEKQLANANETAASVEEQPSKPKNRTGCSSTGRRGRLARSAGVADR